MVKPAVKRTLPAREYAARSLPEWAILRAARFMPSINLLSPRVEHTPRGFTALDVNSISSTPAGIVASLAAQTQKTPARDVP
jgi:hypothetical protein